MSVGLTDVRSTMARVILLLTMAAAMLVLPELTSDPPLQAVLPGLCLLLFLNIAPAVWERKPDLFAPPVYHGLVTAFGTAATMASWILNDELTVDLVRGVRTDELVEYAQLALLVLLVGTASYYLGYYLPFGTSWKRIFPKLQGMAWSRTRVLVLSAVAAGIFIVTYAVFQSRVGVSLFDFTNLAAGKRTWHGEWDLSWMRRGIEIGFLPVLLLVSYTLATRRGWRGLLLPGGILLVLALFVTRLGQRGAPMAVLITMLVQFHYHRRRIPITLFALLGFLGIVVGNIMFEWRNAPEEEVRTFEVYEGASAPLEVLAAHESERQRFSATVLIVKEFPDNVPYLMGESWASLVVLLVPRWIWPEKVDHFKWRDDHIIINLIGSPTPPPYYATFYANLSWVGVFLLSLLYGMFHRGLYEWLRASQRDRNTILLYSLFLVYFGPSMLNASSSLQYILPIWVILKFVSRPPDSTPETI